MRQNSRRLVWAAIVVLLLVLVGGGAFWLGVVAGRGDVSPAMPMRGFAFRYPGSGLLGLLVPLLVIGSIVTCVVLLVAPGRSASPLSPAVQPSVAPPRDGSDGVDRLRELVAMHANGQLTDEEFTAAKRRFLGM